jgi:hypothetical protein
VPKVKAGRIPKKLTFFAVKPNDSPPRVNISTVLHAVLNFFNQAVYDFDVYFLDAVGETLVRHTQLYIGQGR